ncbi:sugar nucleotide-binding protein [Pantoea alfalfae]|uniref:sugar nucleotide-binding protein n=1 Tax=Pantoea alfalfae TaxID=3074822 RepID=UPI0021CD0F48|nr:sugar nucleotide-binding protein [Pantoea alfalfae]
MLSKDNALEIIDVSKCYQVFDSPVRRLKQFIVPNIERKLGKVPRVYHEEFWALQDISFNLPKGETLGVVGRNGSGKSTLLQIIAGTLSPTQGSVNIQGRVAALLELGAGFNGDFTGRENVYLNGALLGLTKEEIDSKLDDILSFADIGHFINNPVKTYSSGMMVRLAFAVQAQIDPEILIVDEALAVGDAKFQAKCFARLKQLKNDGTSILFVSHATEQIITHCDKAILLNDGSIVGNGAPKDIVNKYLDLLFGKSSSKLAKDRESLSVINDQFGAPTGAELIADCTAHAIRVALENSNVAGLYHLIAAGETTWHAYATKVIEFAKAQGVELQVQTINAVPTSAFPTPAKRPANSRLNTDKFQQTFGLNLPDWTVGVERMLLETLI